MQKSKGPSPISFEGQLQFIKIDSGSNLNYIYNYKKGAHDGY